MILVTGGSPFFPGLLNFISQAEEKELWIGGELPNRDKAKGWFFQRFSTVPRYKVQLLQLLLT